MAYLAMVLFELGLPLLLAGFGVYCIWRALRVKPEPGDAAKKVRRWPRVLLGLVLITPAFWVCSFLAYHLPEVISLRRQYVALEKEFAQPHWPKVSTHENEWFLRREYWIAPWAQLFAPRSHFEIQGSITRGADRGIGSYLKSLACTPGLHYGKYIRGQVPYQLMIGDVRSAKADGRQLSAEQIASMFEPFAVYIRNLGFVVDRKIGFEAQAFDGFTGLKSVSVNTNDLKVADWACRRPGLEYLYVDYSGPSSDVQGLAECIAACGHSLRYLATSPLRTYTIDLPTFQRIYHLPRLESLNLSGFQVDVTGVAEPLFSPKGNQLKKFIRLNLVGCSDALLDSLDASNAWYVRLDLNHSPVTDKGLGWLRRAGVQTLDLSNAPGITFESAQLLPDSLTYLHLRNVGLTDKGLQLLDPQKLFVLDVEGCPVSDPALIQFLKNSGRLTSIGLGDRKLSEELLREIVQIGSKRVFTVMMEASGDREIDLFLDCAIKPSRLEVCVFADWSEEKAGIYSRKFKDAGMTLRVVKPGSDSDLRRW